MNPLDRFFGIREEIKMPCRPDVVRVLPHRGIGFVIVNDEHTKQLYKHNVYGDPVRLGEVIKEGPYGESAGRPSYCTVVLNAG